MPSVGSMVISVVASEGSCKALVLVTIDDSHISRYGMDCHSDATWKPVYRKVGEKSGVQCLCCHSGLLGDTFPWSLPPSSLPFL